MIDLPSNIQILLCGLITLYFSYISALTFCHFFSPSLCLSILNTCLLILLYADI